MLYNVINAGGEVLNLDGPLDYVKAFELSNEIESEHNIEVKMVEIDGKAFWRSLNSPVYDVLTQGEHMDDAQCRQLPCGRWLYCDSVDGFTIFDENPGFELVEAK